MAVESVERAREVLTHYFRLEVSLCTGGAAATATRLTSCDSLVEQTDAVPLYAAWTQSSDSMAQLIQSLPGHRLVRQDPVECLFAFICSSNNNIQRIQQMVDKLRATYGTRLLPAASEEDKEENGAAYYSFPTAETLAEKCEEATLRALGFGYRAPFITKASRQLVVLGGASYLHQIRDWKPLIGEDGATDAEDAAHIGQQDAYQEQLMVFAGVGRKVADCVGLFSLERLEAIPVDTHVLQIARREFNVQLAETKSLTPALYKRVGDHFRARFAPSAGWAHSVLFTGDLAAFQSHLPAEMQKPKKPAKKKKTTTVTVVTVDKPESAKKRRASTAEEVEQEASVSSSTAKRAARAASRARSSLTA